MARGNLLLGKAKGKLGSVVFAQANGEQITRSKPESVKNPKSTGQNTQRAILATIAKSAALLFPIVYHSFANIKYGADSVRYFRKINLGILRNLVLNAQPSDYNLTAKGGTAVPNYLKVSEGNLPAFSSSADSGDIAFYGNNNYLPADDDVDVGTFKQAYPNLKGGDQLTLVKIVKTAGSLADGDAIFALKVNRIVFAPNAFDEDGVNIITAGVLNVNLLDLTKTTDAEMVTSVDGGAGHGLGFTASSDNTYAAALILSRKVNGKWQRSTQFLEICNGDDTADNAAAIASYGATASVNNQNEYLNQAEKGTGKKGVSGSYANFYSQIGDTENDLSSLHAGETKSVNVHANENAEILLTCSGFGTADNPIVKTEIKNRNRQVINSGQKYCEHIFKLTEDNEGNFFGVVTFKDGTSAEITWDVAIQG